MMEQKRAKAGSQKQTEEQELSKQNIS